ncbi:MAG: hypothetical protein RIR10_700 [Planctomycetota bacterium]
MLLPDDSTSPRMKPVTDARALFEIWAPAASPWSAWAKPALFTYLPEANSAATERVPWSSVGTSAGTIPLGSGRHAVVVDLPGVEGIACGLALAERGFRPVPLYNLTQGIGKEVVAVDPLITALHDGADFLQTLAISDDAPPAFLLDSNRHVGVAAPSMFDNRWMVFPQDFPSARALMSAGVERVLVIRREGAPRVDLLSVLRLWKREGLASARFDPASGETTDLSIDTSMLAVFSAHLSMIFHGLRENAAGGFGGRVPVPQATSGGFA